MFNQVVEKGDFPVQIGGIRPFLADYVEIVLLQYVSKSFIWLIARIVI